MPSPLRRPLLGLVALAAAAAGWACGDSSSVAGIAVRVEVTPNRDTLYVGEISTVLSARAFNAENDEITDATITWRSDQPFIVSVDSLTGVVTGMQAGIAAVTAHAGSVADTATIVVINALQISLPFDTIALAPGDTITVPVDVRSVVGPEPPVTFAGGAPGVATIDPASGLVTAIGPGSAAFSATADTVSATGRIQVITLPDTLVGVVTAVFEGAVTQRGTWESRSFNHPNDLGGTMYQISALTPSENQQFALVLLDSLVTTGTRTIGTLPPAGIVPPADPVCRPTTSFGFYRNNASLRTALSTGGSVTITTLTPVPGGKAASGRFDVTLQIIDIAGTAGRMRVWGTFVVPVVSRTVCPT